MLKKRVVPELWHRPFFKICSPPTKSEYTEQANRIHDENEPNKYRTNWRQAFLLSYRLLPFQDLSATIYLLKRQELFVP